MKDGRYEAGDIFIMAGDDQPRLVIRRYVSRESDVMDLLLPDGTIESDWQTVVFKTDTVIE